MTDANSNFGSSGGAPASGASGFDASAIGGPTPTAGDYTAGYVPPLAARAAPC
jgi:hypothetical protein